MDIIQKLAKFLMIIVILPILTGCIFINKEETAKKALKEKYQEEFEISEIFDQKLGESSYRVQANPVSDSTLNFRASVEFKDHALSDNYVERIICHKINTQVEKNLNGLPGDYQ